MSNADWPNVDQTAASLPTMVSSSDLFDGDLFGDELIDIYNSTVGENHGDAVDANDIPNLLIPMEDGAIVKQEEDDEKHPGMQVADAAAAMDDGLGAFRPSTSFNDLTTLYDSNAVKGNDTKKSAKATGSKVVDTKGQKKRKSTGSDSPSPKKKASGARVNRKPSTKKQGATGPATAKGRNGKGTGSTDKDDTPNPLVKEMVISTPVKAQAKPTVAPTPDRTKSSDKTAAPVTPSTPGATASEADFKSIAQAAVSNLMMSASTDKDSVSKAVKPDEKGSKVDISTAHIKALTGNNWVAACTNPSSGASTGSSPADDAKANNRARRQNLTPDERARQNRDRNREHARNTRLRKKAYVEELKRTLMELVAQRDATDFEKRQAAQRELEQREVRFRVIEELLKLRGTNEPNSKRWSAILEDGFHLTLPITSFRKMAVHEEVDGEQVITGVSNVMADSSYVSEFMQTLAVNASEPVCFTYVCERKNFFMDGCSAVLEWTAFPAPHPALKESGKNGFRVKGSIRAKFSPASNKLISATIAFDTGSVTSLLRKANETVGCDVAEEAVDAAQAAASQADALLDSIQMPRLSAPVPSAVTVVPPSSSSASSSSDKDDESTDTSVAEGAEPKETTSGVEAEAGEDQAVARRALRSSS